LSLKKRGNDDLDSDNSCLSPSSWPGTVLRMLCGQILNSLEESYLTPKDTLIFRER
jgi:hypothetical protein